LCNQAAEALGLTREVLAYYRDRITLERALAAAQQREEAVAAEAAAAAATPVPGESLTCRRAALSPGQKRHISFRVLSQCWVLRGPGERERT
jgi:hypothetical protein